VAVFSGQARQKIPDAGFASGDTDISTSRNFDRPKTKTGELLKKAKTIFTPPAGLTEVPPKNAARAVLFSVAGIVITNMLMLWLSGIFGWKIFGLIWPMELVVVGVLLVALMVSLPSPWLLIPGGIVLGNGFLLSYFALSGNWQAWTILWPLEPLLVAVCIIAPFLLARRGAGGQWLTRRIGNSMLILSVLVFIVSLCISILIK
jgi:hypothetical protein